MFDGTLIAGPYSAFIAMAYGISALVLIAMVWRAIAVGRARRRMLTFLEEQGLRRSTSARGGSNRYV